ncbi:MAG: MotA/TolQ/ExbB proton channel family protein [Verrucomicrobiales bacterium]
MTLLFTEQAANIPPILAIGSDAIPKIVYFLRSGGLFMLFIGVCSLIALSVVVHRAVFLRRKNVLPVLLEGELVHLERRVADGDTSRIGQILSEDDSTLARISRMALSGEHGSREEAAAALEVVAREEIVKLQVGIAALEVVITIAPLLGLLGTVSGLVSVFGTLGGAGAELSDPAEVARGIAEALNTTIAGMVVAVPTVIAHSYFSKKIERYAVRMEVLMAMALAVIYRGGDYDDPEAVMGAAPRTSGETSS